MHKYYCDPYPDDGVSYYQKKDRVESLDIRFFKLGEEECEVCELHTSHLKKDYMLSKLGHNAQSKRWKSKKSRSELR